jgi:N-acetylmuramoyl-L-alanine amidase
MRQWAAALVAAWLLLSVFSGSPAIESESFQIDLGTRTLKLPYNPVVVSDGRNYIALDILKSVDSFKELKSGPRIETGPQPETGDEDDEAISVRHPSDKGGRLREFSIGSHKYSLEEATGGLQYPVDEQGTKLGSSAMAIGPRIYLAQDTLFEMGIALSYSPETGNLRLLGTLTGISGDRASQTLNVNTLLPSRATASGIEGGFRVVLDAVFVKENFSKEIFGNSISVSNLPYHRLEIIVKQETLTGYKVFAPESGDTAFTIHLANHFDVISTERTSSGEIALTVGFTRPVEIKSQIIQSPPRLVLDFAGATYSEATKYIDVKVGGVRQIRVGQFTQDPPVVRVVVEMSRQIDYRILKQGDGDKYYIQMLSGKLSKAAIMLDAGHGGSDTGAIGITNCNESDIVLGTTQQLQRKLESMGYEVVQTRSDNSFVSLGERADYANEVLPMIFVSIHANSIENPEFTGVMTFHYAGSKEGEKLASAIQRYLLSSTGAVDRGVRTANFFVLRETVVPAVLVEIGFLTNSIEEYKLRDPLYQQRIVDGIAAGIDEYMKVFGGR